MSGRILYCGDTALTAAASYLTGIMTHDGIEYDYHSSSDIWEESWLTGAAGVVLSDYPAANFPAAAMEKLTEQVRQGLGLLMIGGTCGIGRRWMVGISNFTSC